LVLFFSPAFVDPSWTYFFHFGYVLAEINAILPTLAQKDHFFNQKNEKSLEIKIR
jgi:hypothetical protein